MNQNLDLAPLPPLLSTNQSALIVFPTNSELDRIAASLALYLALKKAGKKTTIACSQPMTVQFSQLVGVDKITDKIGSRDLVISFDYQKDSIEKVSYNIEDGKFNLVVQAKTGFPSLDPKTVAYSSSGADTELIFSIGVSKLEDLGDLYSKNQSFYQEASIVNIDRQANNSQFGKINLVSLSAAADSELVVLILKELKLAIDEDIATNLYLGLQSATRNFQASEVSADTFEAAAWCLRAGARRPGQSGQQPVDQPTEPQVISQPASEEVANQAVVEETSAPSPDWLSPKIFKTTRRG